MNKAHPIIFFDGVCNVCNDTVDFIMKRDPNVFLFAPLQGKTALEKLDPKLTKGQLKSLVLWDEQGIHTQSRAILRIFSRLKAPWNWVKYLKMIPFGVLDLFYHYISTHRYQWFGKRNTCRLPTTEEKRRFLE